MAIYDGEHEGAEVVLCRDVHIGAILQENTDDCVATVESGQHKGSLPVTVLAIDA